MFWQEKQDESKIIIPEDHKLPWFLDEPEAALHLLHIADSVNGWVSPEKANGFLFPSKRSRLEIRIPVNRIDEAVKQLQGETLSLGQGCEFIPGKHKVRKLVKSDTLFCRFLHYPQKDENKFLQQAVDDMAKLDIPVTKALCGMETMMQLNGEKVKTKRLLFADLEPSQSLLLQRKGLGEYTKYGLGVFLPHKGIVEVGEAAL
ncbi:MAG: type I-MYXAN CRISPR-associated protein Cas6/Cmx6 [bacterium]